MLKKFLILCALVYFGQANPLAQHGFDGAFGTRIAGGVNVTRGEMPWMVSLQYNSFGDISNTCGGVIINETHVLTAAHCVQGINLQYMEVVAGALRIFAGEATQQASKPVERIVHPRFQRGPPVRHDLAILIVSPPFVFNEHVGPLWLPPTNHRASGTCTIAGWGATNQPGPTNFLLKTEVPIISRSKCLLIYGNNYEQDNQICAGYDAGGHDTCQGDTGGPIVCTDTLGYKYVAGIASWGYFCGEPNKPGVYTEVSHYTVGNWQPVHLELSSF